MSERYDLNRLRAAFAQPDDPPHPDQCPADSDIWEAVHGKLPPSGLREIVEHLASCSACAESWRMALALERPTEVEATPAENLPPRLLVLRRRWWRVSGGLAAAAAALFALVIGFHGGRRGEAPMVIAQRGAVETRTAVRWLTPDESTLPRSGARLRWLGPPGATYDLTVELIDERGGTKPVPIAAARSLAATEYTVPGSELVKVPAGALLHVTLTVHLPDGSTENNFLDFRLKETR